MNHFIIILCATGRLKSWCVNEYQRWVGWGAVLFYKVFSTHLPVFWALLCYSYSVIQPNNTSSFLQIFHAASESRCRNVKPDLGYKKGRGVPDQACLRIRAETLYFVCYFSSINRYLFYGCLFSWDLCNTTYFVKLRKSTSFQCDSAFSALRINMIVLTEEWPVPSKSIETENVQDLELPTPLPE